MEHLTDPGAGAPPEVAFAAGPAPMVSIAEQQQDASQRARQGVPGEPSSCPMEGALAGSGGQGDSLHRKFLHSAGTPGTPGADAAVRGEHSPPREGTTAREGWQPMPIRGDFSATWAKFLHMQHRARATEPEPEPAPEDSAAASGFSASSTCAQLGKRRREGPEECGGEGAATVPDRPANCSPPEKKDSGGDRSPVSSEHPLSINSTASELHSVTRAAAETLPGDDIGDGIAAADCDGALPGV